VLLNKRRQKTIQPDALDSAKRNRILQP